MTTAGWTWIIPTRSGSQSPKEWALDEGSRHEAEEIAKRLGTRPRPAYLAPSAGELEALLPTFFPIRLEFGEGGAVRRILLGDAARASAF